MSFAKWFFGLIHHPTCNVSSFQQGGPSARWQHLWPASGFRQCGNTPGAWMMMMMVMMMMMIMMWLLWLVLVLNGSWWLLIIFDGCCLMMMMIPNNLWLLETIDTWWLLGLCCTRSHMVRCANARRNPLDANWRTLFGPAMTSNDQQEHKAEEQFFHT